ncbi:MAG: thioredoxin family protein [Candidatus Micrarchaeia archaeon]
MTSDFKPPELPKFDFSDKTTADGKLIVYYFYSPHCQACIALRPDMDRLEAAYKDVEWLEYDITTQNGTMAYVEFATERNLSTQQRMVPQVLVNGTVITDRFNINKTLPEILGNASPRKP